jgi:hypothetical protein
LCIIPSHGCGLSSIILQQCIALAKGSSKGSLDSSDGGQMQPLVGFFSDPALPFNHPSIIN